MSPLATNSRMAAIRNQSARRRWISGNEVRRRSRRGGKSTPHRSWASHLISFAPFQPDQETVTQHHQHGIAMKAMPQAALILIPAHFAFGFFMILFNPVAPMCIFDHLPQSRLRREITPKIFPVTRLARGPAVSNQPAEKPLSLAVDAPASYRHETGAQPPARAFFPAFGMPLAFGEGFQDGTDFLNWGDLPSAQADTKIRAHFDHVAFPAGLQTIEKRGIIAISGIG